MTEKGILVRKETVTHERMPDGSIRVTRIVERKVHDKSDRMSTSHEVEIL